MLKVNKDNSSLPLKLPARLETQRLVIRKLKATDFQSLYQMIFSPFVMKFNMLQEISYEEFVKEYQADAPENLYVALKDSDQLLGQISVHQDQIRYGVNSVTLSYWLGEDFVRHGYMNEALRVVINELFERQACEIITSRVFSPNTPSQKLLEKLGFQKEAYLKHAVRNRQGQVFDDIFYVLFK